MEKISVIVPVYKVEKYFTKCIESIINQTYKNLEIILVDDGSPDKCPQMCDEYAEKDKRIKVIHKENGGVSSARNIGIKEATGEYIAFVDPDDWIEKDMYETLYNRLKEENADCVRGKYIINENQQSEETIKERIFEDEEIKEKFIYKIAFEGDKSKENDIICPAFTTYIFKAEIIKNNELFFEETMKMAEDFKFLLRVLINTKKIVIIDKVVYHYRLRMGSATNSYKPTFLNDMMELNKYIMEIYEKRDIKEVLNKRKKENYTEAILNVCYGDVFRNYKQRIKELKMIRKKMIEEDLFDLKIKDAGAKRDVLVFLLKHNKLNFILIIGSIYFGIKR